MANLTDAVAEDYDTISDFAFTFDRTVEAIVSADLPGSTRIQIADLKALEEIDEKYQHEFLTPDFLKRGPSYWAPDLLKLIEQKQAISHKPIFGRL